MLSKLFSVSTSFCSMLFTPPKNSLTNTSTITIPQLFKAPESEKRVLYIDSAGVIWWPNPLDTIVQAVNQGWNIINLAFYLGNGTAFDMLKCWADATPQQREDCLNYVHARNAIIVMAVGGDTVAPFLIDPEVFAADACNWAVQYQLDGVEFDLENIQAGFTYPGVPDLYEWMRKMNNKAHEILGDTRYLMHCPQAPYLSAPGHSDSWPGIKGGYYQVYQDAPFIDYLCVQMYNQGEDAYPTYESCYTTNVKFPYSAQSQVNNDGKGIPYYKQVLGVTMQPSDGSSGYHPPDQVSDWLTRAQSEFKVPRNSMVWQYHYENDGSPSPLTWLHTMYPQLSGIMKVPVSAQKKRSRRKRK